MTTTWKKAFTALVVASGLAWNLAVSHAQDCSDKYNALTDEQRASFNIMSDEWKAATTGANPLPPHAFIVGCKDCEGAAYDSAGNLTNGPSLWKIPTSWLMKVPQNCNGKTVVIVPPGTLSHVTAFNAFAGIVSQLMNEGFAVVAMDHVAPGYPGFPYDAFIAPPFHTHNFRTAYFSTGHLLRDLVSEVFGEPTGYYAFAHSRGVSLGLGLLVGENGTPFDGYILGVGGTGALEYLESHTEAFAADRVPLTGVIPLESLPPANTEDARKLGVFMGNINIGVPDPEYLSEILAEPTVSAQLAKAMAYDFDSRSHKIKKAWGHIAFDPDIKKPVIILAGLRDRSIYPSSTLQFAGNIIEAGKTDMFRLYLVKDMAHSAMDGPASNVPSLNVGAIKALDSWVHQNAEPQSLNGGAFGAVPSCTARGYSGDPMGCFCEVIGNGVGGTCSLDPSTACITANPASATPPDSCIAIGKGTCQAVRPAECPALP
ncbi:MAG TPA: hypothetical protein VJR29_00740 [bacterium]|nr:hypothetical protein [bacterium]